MDRYDDHTALVVVDVQNDFADPAGSLSVPGGDAVIGNVNDEITAATEAGSTVVYTQDWHPPRTPHFAIDGGPWPVHCVRDTWGAELHPDLVVIGPPHRVTTVHKGTGGEDGYSAFTLRDPTDASAAGTTGLAETLRDEGVERVVVVGLALDYCVKATALDAVDAGFDATVVRAATAAVDVESGDGDRAVAELVAGGVSVV